MDIHEALNNKNKTIDSKKNCTKCNGTGILNKRMVIVYQYVHPLLPHLQKSIEWESEKCMLCGGKGHL